ncbi:MAG: rhodanese-like domain-containing protein [Nitrospirae bacterium]|nr:rhodanese-like domain-containing protein [Nitrospirota bacterium]
MLKSKILMVALIVTVMIAGGIAFAGTYSDALTQKVMTIKADGEGGKDMPVSLPGVNLINGADAHKMWKDKKAVFLDARTKTQFDTEKVTGAELFTADDFINNPAMADKLDKNKAYVLYCNGVKCWRSTAVAMILAEHFGFKNVYWYRDGFPDWKKSGYSVE